MLSCHSSLSMLSFYLFFFSPSFSPYLLVELTQLNGRAHYIYFLVKNLANEVGPTVYLYRNQKIFNFLDTCLTKQWPLMNFDRSLCHLLMRVRESAALISSTIFCAFNCVLGDSLVLKVTLLSLPMIFNFSQVQNAMISFGCQYV